MELLIIALILGVPAALLGYFFGLVPLVIISITLLIVFRNLEKSHRPGTSTGIVLAISGMALIYLLTVMWITAILVRVWPKVHHIPWATVWSYIVR